jgi:putative addiction module component (TIGR02574 family)
MRRAVNMSESPRFSFLDGLSVAERILLVEEIWDSIAAEQSALEITQEQKDELDWRLAEYEANPNAGASWEQVKERLRGKA